MDNSDLYCIEKWKKVPYDTLYEYHASTLGRVRKVLHNGKYLILKPHIGDRNNGRYLQLVLLDGKAKNFYYLTIIGDTFLGRKKGMNYTTKNGIKTDLRIENIGYAKIGGVVARNNVKRQKAVLKIDKKGNVVDIYKNATECGLDNGYCRRTIVNYCNNQIKSIFNYDGYTFCYEDDNKQLQKIRKKLREQYGKDKQGRRSS